MSTAVLICDDSGFARRQMARSIPDGWDVDISFAENGKMALEQIHQGKADVMFLDLNMPVMDGYQTMQAIKDQDLPTMVIVVSGDVQPEARERMLKLGALDFIRKPIDNLKLSEILEQYGLYAGDQGASRREKEQQQVVSIDSPMSEKLDIFREMANVAMGQAGEKLATLLDEFIDLPIPNVNLIESTELHMAIAEVQRNAQVSAISQGFISAGIKGEALLIFNDANFADMVKLLDYKNTVVTEELELEALLDVSNILISACLHALSTQLHVNFSHNHPIVLGRHCDVDALLSNNVSRWSKIMAVEIGYAIKSHGINFDLLLLFPDHSMDLMFERLVDLTGDE
ncbi:response regulator [Aestuariibacter halophilus]|uniref:Response regulator n=1 Tax=Fluctibacter halophilus TaxID=226011 RepID=A0ABS8GBS7_9ALTE|nr:response regulator [Aestuariibacter halophilus]MCC2617953.1 response regulator [Aestuariibacter halophilus]